MRLINASGRAGNASDCVPGAPTGRLPIAHAGTEDAASGLVPSDNDHRPNPRIHRSRQTPAPAPRRRIRNVAVEVVRIQSPHNLPAVRMRSRGHPKPAIRRLKFWVSSVPPYLFGLWEDAPALRFVKGPSRYEFLRKTVLRRLPKQSEKVRILTSRLDAIAAAMLCP
jgi:hypothetical protein